MNAPSAAPDEPDFHRLLKRQIKKTLGKNAQFGEELKSLLILINDTYHHYDEDRKLLDRAMDLSSNELFEANQYLVQQKNDLDKAYQDLKNTQQELKESQQIARLTEELQEQKKELEAAHQEILENYERLRQTQLELQAQNEYLDEKNRQLAEINLKISSSLRVAETIQQAVLPYQEKMDELLRKYFVINLPKDVVSGDFFWLNEVEGKTILIVADCTGHGVPGAFMTLIGVNLLDKIIRVWGVTDPASILTRLHEEVQIVLRQQETGNRNGMDMVAITLEQQENKTLLTFSGAKNNLFYWDKHDIKELKATRKSIGGLQSAHIAFENQTVTLSAGDTIYVGSDGLEDQNNATRRRLGRQKLRELLESVVTLPVEEQKVAIETMLGKYMHNTDQRDDILWMGIQL